jgi:type II secretory pathway pseudopilin PulG
MTFFLKSPPRNPCLAFSLLEMLVATAVLSMMMVFLFTLVSQTIVAWETGNRKMEAAQAARTGLQKMAEDLRYAMAGAATAPSSGAAAAKTSIIPFYSANNAEQNLGFPPSFRVAPLSGQIFAVASMPERGNELCEIGFACVYLSAADGYDHLPGRTYYLMRHIVPVTTQAVTANMFFANTLPPNPTASGGWINEETRAVQDKWRTSLIPNCFQIALLYAENTPAGLRFQNNWPDQDRLPAGVLITAKVMDSKTAARIARIQPAGLTANDVAPNSTTLAGRLLREGSVEIHRFIPFYNSRQ